MRACLTLLVLAALCGCAQAPPETHVLAIVEAERALSRSSDERGSKAAFLATLADDAVVLRPTPTPGRAYFHGQPDAGPKWTWEPSYAEVSRGGDFGYTTGPCRLAHADGEVRFGHLVSVWQVQDKRWRVVLAGDSQHPPPLQVSEALTYLPPRPAAPAGPPVDFTAELRTLMAADDALIAAWTGPGSQALLAHATDDLRYFPPDALPLTGRGAVLAALAAGREELSFTPVGAGLASLADLGYTYGRATRKAGPTAPAATGGYLRVWRRAASGVWQVALELHAMPPRQ